MNIPGCTGRYSFRQPTTPVKRHDYFRSTMSSWMRYGQDLRGSLSHIEHAQSQAAIALLTPRGGDNLQLRRRREHMHPRGNLATDVTQDNRVEIERDVKVAIRDNAGNNAYLYVQAVGEPGALAGGEQEVAGGLPSLDRALDGI